MAAISYPHLRGALAAARFVNRRVGNKHTRVVIHGGRFRLICVNDCNHFHCCEVDNRPHWPGYTQGKFRSQMREGDI